MFIEFFDWFCNCLASVFDTMKKFVLFENFTYYHFFIGLLAVAIIFRILKLIMLIEDEESNIQPRGDYIIQYDGYIPKHAKVYKPKHARKKRGWF